MHEYQAVFTCDNCRWENDQTIEEDEPTEAAAEKRWRLIAGMVPATTLSW